MRPCLLLFSLCVGFTACPFASALDPPDGSNASGRPTTQIEFLSADLGQAAIRDDSHDNFFGRLRKREIAAMTASQVEGKSLAEARQYARDFFGGAVLEFRDDEREAIEWFVARIEQQMSAAYPLFVQQPWSFIKVRADLCGSFSFTRGSCIVLSERTYRRLVEARSGDQDEALRRLGLLLVHEQLHVLQRRFPQRFQQLYEDVFGFRRARVSVHDWIDRRQISNPDGLDEDWIVAIPSANGDKTQYYWMCTILAEDHPVPQMGRDFSAIAVQVQAMADGSYEMITDRADRPVYRPLEECQEFLVRFPIRNGHDHPNEIAAYLFTQAIEPLILGQEETAASTAKIVAKSREWFRTNL